MVSEIIPHLIKKIIKMISYLLPAIAENRPSVLSLIWTESGEPIIEVGSFFTTDIALVNAEMEAAPFELRPRAWSEVFLLGAVPPSPLAKGQTLLMVVMIDHRM